MRLFMIFVIAIVCMCLPVRADLFTHDEPPNPPPLDRRPNGIIEKMLNCRCFGNFPVTEVTQQSITLGVGGVCRWKEGRTLPDGTPICKDCEEFVPFRLMKLPVSKQLMDGSIGDAPNVLRYSSYRLSDVKVGDKVTLTIQVIDGRYTCTNITINRRPGGRVPLAPLDDLPNDDSHHDERANAYQDLEERGIPLPDKYDPDKLAEDAEKRTEAMLRRAR